MSDNCGAANRNGEPCGLPAGWGTDHNGDGRCKFHGGASPGAPEGHTNSVTHGAYAEHNKLYSEAFSERERDLADRVFKDFYDLYVDQHGVEPPAGHKMRLFKIAVNAVTEMRVENWYTDKPDTLETGTPYINRETHVSESGERYYRYKKSPSVPAIKHLEGYNRKWLSELGLLPDADDDGLSDDAAGIIAILSEERA